MKGKTDIIPLSELAPAVEGLVPYIGRATKALYVAASGALAILIVLVVTICI